MRRPGGKGGRDDITTIAIVISIVFGLIGCKPTRPEPSKGWLITVYYTAVESYHAGPSAEVFGCPDSGCAWGKQSLGRYPAGFADAVRDEGTGRITAGSQAGRYLNWSYDIGYWLANAPLDSRGEPLEPFVSAAADRDVLTLGSRFSVVACGTTESGETPPRAVCAKIGAAGWQIRDEFTPGLGGPRHIDLYIGEESGPEFRSDVWYISLRDASIVIG
ncbi:hypothetical protein [Amycolatopsis sp. EV170708-02-1]|uniref:hypothetical protein n=1 Tax=Amycolatopsis sp. EV170708-02-1 TaxID=2919322 RepID=UPI001F0CA40F|nr:hypothetical protein [Amycolatopsis sp. EV170708-02-1]UMP06819.1 hypothetical protein MJQ72_19305 [Amycolatopsis sp. EV170708-02-1]